MKRNVKGFTLLELIVVIAIITLLAGVLTPLVRQSLEDARIAKVLSLVDTLKKAASRFNFDNTTWPAENTAGTNNLFSNAAMPATWRGPYLDAPISLGSSPWGAASLVAVVGSLNGRTPVPDAYVIAGGASGAVGAELSITLVPTVAVTALDLAIDGVAGQNVGLCEWTTPAAGTSTVFIYLAR